LAVGLMLATIARQAAAHARRAAAAASVERTRFFAMACHDLRQPLHALGLLVQILRAHHPDPRGAALAHVMHEAVDDLDRLFGILLDASQLELGRFESAPQAVDLAELKARLHLQFEPEALEKGLVFGIRGFRHTVRADPVYLERVLRNLLANAIRSTPDGGVLVTARLRRGDVILQVWDSGVGMSQAALAMLRDDCAQAAAPSPSLSASLAGDGTGSARGSGPRHGLGLAIVKRLALLMDAPLAVRSQPGRGTVVSITLPRVSTSAPGPAPN
jgi:signal transduction histidine kinase